MVTHSLLTLLDDINDIYLSELLKGDWSVVIFLLYPLGTSHHNLKFAASISANEDVYVKKLGWVNVS